MAKKKMVCSGQEKARSLGRSIIRFQELDRGGRGEKKRALNKLVRSPYAVG